MLLPNAENLKNGTFDSVAEVAQLRRSPVWNLLLQACDRLQTRLLYASAYHGADHIERVMLLGAIIAMQQHFTPRETELLLIACSYHDIGRINDYRDEKHGRRAADMLPSIPGLGADAAELACIQAAVATHSTDDGEIDLFAREYAVPQKDLALCRRLCKGLKDADNLDRVRIGDLDIRHLRFPESKGMRAAAEAIWRLSV